MTIQFLRNKVVEVGPQADGTIRTSWRLTDDLLRANVNLKVQPPDLEIVQAEAELHRLVPEAWLHDGFGWQSLASPGWTRRQSLGR